MKILLIEEYAPCVVDEYRLHVQCATVNENKNLFSQNNVSPFTAVDFSITLKDRVRIRHHGIMPMSMF